MVTSGVYDDPYVQRVLELADDDRLFSWEPDGLRLLRTELLRECLDYFVRRCPAYYQPRLENLRIDPQNAVLSDLVRLAVPSQTLRGGRWDKMAIPEVAKGAEMFTSSGTTGGAFLTVGRSPIDDQITRIAIPRYVSHAIGQELAGGIMLMLATPALARKLILFRDPLLYYGARRTEIYFGLRETGSSVVSRERGMEVDWQAVEAFASSSVEPKFLFGAPSSLQNLAQKLPSSQLDLGIGGAVFSAGGSKRADVLPLPELRELAKRRFMATDCAGRQFTAPWFDGLGHTEGLMICLTDPDGEVRVPHPLEEVFLVDENLQLLESGKGFAGHWNPLNTTYFEAFYPGDYYEAVNTSSYYGRGFRYIARAELNRDGAIRAGCSAAIVGN